MCSVGCVMYQNWPTPLTSHYHPITKTSPKLARYLHLKSWFGWVTGQRSWWERLFQASPLPFMLFPKKKPDEYKVKLHSCLILYNNLCVSTTCGKHHLSFCEKLQDHKGILQIQRVVWVERGFSWHLFFPEDHLSSPSILCKTLFQGVLQWAGNVTLNNLPNLSAPSDIKNTVEFLIGILTETSQVEFSQINIWVK